MYAPRRLGFAFIGQRPHGFRDLSLESKSVSRGRDSKEKNTVASICRLDFLTVVLPCCVMVAHRPLEARVMVRIHAGQ